MEFNPLPGTVRENPLRCTVRSLTAPENNEKFAQKRVSLPHIKLHGRLFSRKFDGKVTPTRSP